jgi:valyl-tRNA synthetase
MALSKRYDPAEAEPRLQQRWAELGIYTFPREGSGRVYSIDTPPPTVSGKLHLGHVFSYSHTDFAARFHRMRGERVYYPMGYDDNGLPTERLVEKSLGRRAQDMGRAEFVEKCLEIGRKAEEEYRTLWLRLGLSCDLDHPYRTIGPQARRISQLSFLRLHRQGRIYRSHAPTLWCPECRTALAQADLGDLERETVFHTLLFVLADGGGAGALPVATTRPELLPACVAVLVHPEDERFRTFVGHEVTVPLYERRVPVRTDPQADPAKGTGAVMVCTFGDATDVEWWRIHRLPLVEALDRGGCLTEAAGAYAGLAVLEARRRMVGDLEDRGLLRERKALPQSLRVHERCDTPVEYIVTRQWFIRVLDRKDDLLAAGDSVSWHPESMKVRFRQWVESLAWDWCISRQRFHGVPFPLWTCSACGEVMLAPEEQLPIDPASTRPVEACACGCRDLAPEEDVLDTWATSSMTPQIASRWLEDPELYKQVFPMSLRPQAHEIIRTWAFTTMVKSLEHFGAVPWSDIAISGWGLAPEGTGKISKSRGGGPMAPGEMISRASADAVRVWAASTGLGKDSVISEEQIRLGARLATKLWNVARFSEPFLEKSGMASAGPAAGASAVPEAAEDRRFTPADRWALSTLQRLILRATKLWEQYEHASALQETETWFWGVLADNYLEMAKLRLYGPECAERRAAQFALSTLLRTVVKLLAPVLPHVTEEIYQGLFAADEGSRSIHLSPWPQADTAWMDEEAERTGGLLLEIVTAVRRFKSERSLSPGSPLACLRLASSDASVREILRLAEADLRGVSRAQVIEISEHAGPAMDVLPGTGTLGITLRIAAGIAADVTAENPAKNSAKTSMEGEGNS